MSRRNIDSYLSHLIPEHVDLLLGIAVSWGWRIQQISRIWVAQLANLNLPSFKEEISVIKDPHVRRLRKAAPVAALKTKNSRKKWYHLYIVKTVVSQQLVKLKVYVLITISLHSIGSLASQRRVLIQMWFFLPQVHQNHLRHQTLRKMTSKWWSATMKRLSRTAGEPVNSKEDLMMKMKRYRDSCIKVKITSQVQLRLRNLNRSKILMVQQINQIDMSNRRVP